MLRDPCGIVYRPLIIIGVAKNSEIGWRLIESRLFQDASLYTFAMQRNAFSFWYALLSSVSRWSNRRQPLTTMSWCKMRHPALWLDFRDAAVGPIDVYVRAFQRSFPNAVYLKVENADTV